MNQELEIRNDKTDGRSSTASVKLHQSRGDRFVVWRSAPVDGNEFLPDVADAGASAAIVSDPTRAMNSPSDLALLQVQDTLTALHKLAPGYRQLMPQRPLSAPLPISNRITTTNKLASTRGGRFSITGATPKFQPAVRRAPQAVAARGHASFAFQHNQSFELE